VVAKFGVTPPSIPDYLAVVGDSADGYPGISGWGEKAAAAVLSQYPHLEDIPKDWRAWTSVKRAQTLAQSLFENWEDAVLFRTLARLRTDAPVFDGVQDLRWRGPEEQFEKCCRNMRAEALLKRALSLKRGRQ
jgi:5'-3' exonuclease